MTEHLPPEVLRYLTELTQSGFYGRTQEETAALLLKEKLREIAANPMQPRVKMLNKRVISYTP